MMETPKMTKRRFSRSLAPNGQRNKSSRKHDHSSQQKRAKSPWPRVPRLCEVIIPGRVLPSGGPCLPGGHTGARRLWGWIPRPRQHSKPVYFKQRWALVASVFRLGDHFIDRVAPFWSAGLSISVPPQWGAADAEIKVSSVGNAELEGSPSKAWGRSIYSHTCNTYCPGFLPC